jgi:hypothetical protein
LDFEGFKKKCNSRICLRKAFSTDFDKKQTCFTETKQAKCFAKFSKAPAKKASKFPSRKPIRTKIKKDERWEEVRKAVHARDISCRIWANLSLANREYIMENYRDDYLMLRDTLDVEHILQRSLRLDLKYDMRNLVLISRYFHTLLTSFKHPVTRTTINSDERLDILYDALTNNEILRG